jgi:CDP-diacylglycerol--glycerol-3-phosphate 3-phosphatidyltransferase
MFAWLLIVAFISDTVDGVIARAFGFTSELGALLDSIGDFLVYSAAAYGIVCFYPQIISIHGFAFVFVIVLWWGSGLAGLWRYGRLASFHTSLSRLTACGAGVFLGVLFIWGFNTWLFWTAVVLVAVSVVEVLILVILLPTWMPNVRGLYWLVVDRVKQK